MRVIVVVNLGLCALLSAGLVVMVNRVPTSLGGQVGLLVPIVAYAMAAWAWLRPARGRVLWARGANLVVLAAYGVVDAGMLLLGEQTARQMGLTLLAQAVVILVPALVNLLRLSAPPPEPSEVA